HPSPSLDWISRPDLREWIDRLPRVQRQVVVLRYLIGCSFAEIGRVLQRSEAGVRQSHYKALLAVRADAAEVEHLPAPRQRQSKAMRALRLPRRIAQHGFSL